MTMQRTGDRLTLVISLSSLPVERWRNTPPAYAGPCFLLPFNETGFNIKDTLIHFKLDLGSKNRALKWVIIVIYRVETKNKAKKKHHY